MLLLFALNIFKKLKIVLFFKTLAIKKDVAFCYLSSIKIAKSNNFEFICYVNFFIQKLYILYMRIYYS